MALDLGGRTAEAEPGLRVAGRHPARRRRLAPVLPGRPGRAGQARRQQRAPTSPPACGTTGCSPTTGASSRPCGRWSSRPSTSCSTCRRPAARSSGPATPTARRGRFALLTGSSSICHSLRCAIAIAQDLGHERPDWEISAARLARVIRDDARRLRPQAPLGHGLVLPRARRRGARRDGPRAPRRAPRHLLIEGRGVRCVSRPPVDHRGRDLRVRARPPRRRRPTDRAESCSRGPSSSAHRRRPLLDRHRLPRGGPLPRRRASTYTAAVGDPGRRRPRRRPAGVRAVRRPRLPARGRCSTRPTRTQPSLDGHRPLTRPGARSTPSRRLGVLAVVDAFVEHHADQARPPSTGSAPPARCPRTVATRRPSTRARLASSHSCVGRPGRRPRPSVRCSCSARPRRASWSHQPYSAAVHDQGPRRPARS